MHELDLRLSADPMQRAHQISREHETALQDRDDQEIARIALGDFCGDLFITLGDGSFIEQDAYAAVFSHKASRG